MRIVAFLQSFPIFSLYVAYERIFRHFQQRLQQEDVHFLQALILTGLFFEGRPVRPSMLASVFQSSRSNISHALRGLERKGWVLRATQTTDARVYEFTLTKSGHQKALRLVKILDMANEQFESSDSSTLMVQLQKLIQTYEGHGPQP